MCSVRWSSKVGLGKFCDWFNQLGGSQNEHREHHRENSAECRHCSTPRAGAAKAVVAAFLEACATIEILDLEVRPYKVAPVSDLVMPE